MTNQYIYHNGITCIQMIDIILNRRVKVSNHKHLKRKNDKVQFDRVLKNKKIKYISDFKHTHECVLCHETSPCCLEFHHIDPITKLFTISSAVCNIKISLKELRNEIKKCVILCSNCHKKLHSNEINVTILQEILNS